MSVRITCITESVIANLDLHTYMHTYIHTYKHACIHSYTHIYIYIYIYIYITYNNIIFISLKGLLQIAMGLIGVTTPTK